MALPYIEKLQEMTWSKIYYPDVHDQFKKIEKSIQSSTKISEEMPTTNTPSADGTD